MTSKIDAQFYSHWLTLDVFMKLSHFSKEFYNKPVLWTNVMKELSLSSTLLGAFISPYVFFEESGLDLPN